MIFTANRNQGKIKDEELLDIAECEDETDMVTLKFKQHLDDFHATWTASQDLKLQKNPSYKVPSAPWHYFVMRAILKTFMRELAVASFYAVLAEGIAVTYVYFLYFLFEYIKDPSIPYTTGIWMVVIYGLAVFSSAICKNYYIFLGYNLAVRLRKAVVSSMYDKIGKLSSKSLTETNSGKLITIISGELFNVERAICLMPIIPAAPIIIGLALFYISRSAGWLNALYTLIIQLLCLVGQHICNKYLRKYRMIDAKFSDQRMMLVNDFVSGIRTIKSYAWENHYLN
jgi:ABC-type multidrug transport system fused ATPase/permease subunit